MHRWLMYQVAEIGLELTGDTDSGTAGILHALFVHHLGSVRVSMDVHV